MFLSSINANTSLVCKVTRSDNGVGTVYINTLNSGVFHRVLVFISILQSVMLSSLGQYYIRTSIKHRSRIKGGK